MVPTQSEQFLGTRPYYGLLVYVCSMAIRDTTYVCPFRGIDDNI